MLCVPQMVDKARTAAVDKVDEKFEAARDKLLEAEMKPLDKAKVRIIMSHAVL